MARPRCSRKEPKRYWLMGATWRSESITTRVARSPCATANRPTEEVAARARPAWLASFKNRLLDTSAVMAYLSGSRPWLLFRRREERNIGETLSGPSQLALYELVPVLFTRVRC